MIKELYMKLKIRSEIDRLEIEGIGEFWIIADRDMEVDKIVDVIFLYNSPDPMSDTREYIVEKKDDKFFRIQDFLYKCFNLEALQLMDGKNPPGKFMTFVEKIHLTIDQWKEHVHCALLKKQADLLLKSEGVIV